MNDEKTEPRNEAWRADFKSASDHMLEAGLAVTVSQRLQWLEQALAFAYRTGALKPREFVTEEEWERRRKEA